ncbi:MAG TPA: DUF4058 family protein [Armatimonadota bacterium]|nr:DUF4058 family protein [Armatimonadota bacterium]
MPGPFNGMDPYLEDPATWPDVHQGLIAAVRADLNRSLPRGYVAHAGERVYIAQPERSIYPDVVVFRRPSNPPGSALPVQSGAAAVADPPVLVSVYPEEVRELFIEIRAVKQPDRVVTTIAILSPSNKTPGSQSRDQYLQKRAELLCSNTHLIEIDLLRAGVRPFLPPAETNKESEPWDYLVSLHRAGDGVHFAVWGIPLLHRLPRITVPLADADPDVILDLQAAFDRCYDEGSYNKWIDYSAKPSAPLSPENARSIDHLLREKGLRPP